MSLPTRPARRSGRSNRRVQKEVANPEDLILDGVDYGRYVVFEKWTDVGDGCRECESIQGLIDDAGNDSGDETNNNDTNNDPTVHRVFEWISFNQFSKSSKPVPNDFERKLPSSNHAQYVQQCRWNPALVPLTKELDMVVQIQAQHGNDRHYFTHDNGGRPFLVYLSGGGQNASSDNDDAASSVSIYKLPSHDLGYYIPVEETEAGITTNDEDEVWKYVEHVATYEMNRIFIGKSPSITMTKSSGGVGSDFDGNSILLHLDALRYVFIGSAIFEFSVPEAIITFVSPVGNNDVPYPVGFSASAVHFFEGSGMTRILNTSFTDSGVVLTDGDDDDDEGGNPNWIKRTEMVIDAYFDGFSHLPAGSEQPVNIDNMVCEGGF